MKPLYIGQKKSHTKKIIACIVLALVCIGLLIKFAFPPALAAYINQYGSDESGYSFKVSDLDFNILKGELNLKRVKVFNHRTSHTFADATNLQIDFNPLEIFSEKIFNISADEMNLIISKDMSEEVKKVEDAKNKSKEETSDPTYIKKIVAQVQKFNLKLKADDNIRTLMTLNDTNARVEELGLGAPKKHTKFALSSSIDGGGEIELDGKTKLEKNNTPWSINGKMTQVTPSTIEQLAGAKFPFEIKESSFNAAITAESDGGRIVGEIKPQLNEFKLDADKEKGFLKRNIAKATNYLANKITSDGENYTITLPFTLDENFKLDLRDTWNKIKKK